MKKLAIFDLDGTLVNTIEDLGHSSNYALAECGYPIHNMASYPFPSTPYYGCRHSICVCAGRTPLHKGK